jgi:hypothetical protein
MLAKFAKKSGALLTRTPTRDFLYSHGQPYDKRWQGYFTYGNFTDPEEDDKTGRPIPEDSPETLGFLGTFRSYARRRFTNVLVMPWGRRGRLNTSFDVFFLPIWTFTLIHFWPISVGFKIMTAIPVVTMMFRVREKSSDPECPETYLRDMIQNHQTLKKHFNVETMVTLDYDFDWITEFPDTEEFPEFKNKIYKFLNSDGNMCKGYFVFADVQTGATMRLDFQTMPVRGNFRYQVAEPYFMFDVVADVNLGGVHEKVVLVDRKKTLQEVRPFLLML